jgi:hypothetical protein
VVSRDFAERFAEEWISAWNSHDLVRILSHYEDDFEMASPRIVEIACEPSGVLRGKESIGAYWEKALRLIPELRPVADHLGAGLRGKEPVKMLELRPTCEHCNKALPPDSTQAMICSFECTFCRSCVEGVLNDVCPNCGGAFSSRPIRPSRNLRGDNFLGAYPPATKVKHRPVDPIAHEQFAANIKGIPAEKR